MAWYDWATPTGAIYSGISHLAGGKGLSGDIKDAYGKVSSWGSQRNGPQIPGNPYMGQWDSLIGQLQKQANGEGPSLATDAFRMASDEGLRQQMTMSHGGSPGAARQAGINMGRINQGQAFGAANARLQEQLAARQSLQQALAGAGNAWFQPQEANLRAQLGTPTNLQQLLAFLQQGAASAGTLMQKGATGGVG